MILDKTFIRACFDQCGLEGLPVTLGIISGKKRGTPRCKKKTQQTQPPPPPPPLENRVSKRTQGTAMPLKASIQSWNSTEGIDHSHTQLSMSSFHCGAVEPPHSWGLWTSSEFKYMNLLTPEERSKKMVLLCCSIPLLETKPVLLLN